MLCLRAVDYFDSIVRQPPIGDAALNVEDNLEFGLISAADLAYYAEQSRWLFTQTDKAILANFGSTGLGDIALVPAPWRRNILRVSAMSKSGTSAQ